MGHNNKKKNKNRNKKKDRRSNENLQENKLENIDHEDNETETLHNNSNLNDSKSKKRQHDDSDNYSENEEEMPRKKKKRKQPVPADTKDKKGKKSIRQMKREKFAERQAAAQAIAKDQIKSQCLTYLSQWKHDKQNWKFMKAKQVWLYKNKFSSTLLPDSSWPLLLEYFESAQGNIRKMLLDDANKIIKQMDEWTESQSDQPTTDAVNEEDDNTNEDSEAPKKIKPNETIYKRARDLIQCLEE